MSDDRQMHPEDLDRRVADAAWKARMEAYQEAQVRQLSRIEAQCMATNGRVGSLEKSRDRNSMLMKALTVIGLGALVKAFSHP